MKINSEIYKAEVLREVNNSNATFAISRNWCNKVKSMSSHNTYYVVILW